jgi:hypothetical protein
MNDLTRFDCRLSTPRAAGSDAARSGANPARTPGQKPGNARGFSLVELLVASGASMVLLAAAFTLLGSIFSSNTTMRQIMETQQTVRVSLNEIARELTRAGTGLPGSGISVPDGTGATPILRPGLGDNLPIANGVIAMVTPGDEAGPTIGGIATDAVTIITIDQSSPIWGVAGVDTSTEPFRVDFFEDLHAGETQLFANDLLLFSNANGSILNMVSAVDDDEDFVTFADGDPIDINQPGAEFGNLISLENPGEPGVYPPTVATRAWIITYYLDDSDPDRPRLMRQRNGQSAVVAEDIDNLQFHYDLFDFETNDDTANQDDTASPNQIRAVSIAINGRASEINRRTGDFHRSGLVTKVSVRNTTFRNRYSGG